MALPSNDLEAARRQAHARLRQQALDRVSGALRAGNFHPRNQESQSSMALHRLQNGFANDRGGSIGAPAPHVPGPTFSDPNNGAQRANAFLPAPADAQAQQQMQQDVASMQAQMANAGGAQRAGAFGQQPTPNLGFHHFPGQLITEGRAPMLGGVGGGELQHLIPGGYLHLGNGIFLHPQSGEIHGFGPHGPVNLTPGGLQPSPMANALGVSGGGAPLPRGAV